MNDSEPDAENFGTILRHWAGTRPDRLAFRFLIDGETEGPGWTYAELDRHARRTAATLLQHASPGDRALLLYPPGLEFVGALFGCLQAGIIAVPAYPPRLERIAHSRLLLANLAEDCRPAVVLTGTAAAGNMQGACSGIPQLDVPWLNTDLLAGPEWHAEADSPRLDDLALLQYTSGSTGDPKGVMITHRNLLHNERMIEAAFEHQPGIDSGLGVCWLPPYHDMGLIGNILHAVYIGATSVLLPPLAIVQRPGRWLRAISHYRADTSGGPNFAYDMCVARIPAEERATLDLSNWSVAAVGAEPIRAETLNRFAEAFERCGFRRETFYPCYGLAEATLMVTGGSKTAPPVVKSLSADPANPGHDIVAVGCGHARLGQEIAIVDSRSSERVGDADTGEIWVTGESVAAGYWNRPDETAETFHARLPGDARHWLRTGDLGLVCDGELFVTGRVKDLIIIRGRNHHPHDIEATVQAAHPGFRADAGAAFSVEVDGEERLAIVQEVDRQARGADVSQLQRNIRQAVAERHELLVHDIVFVRPGGVPKTTSGKVRRSACKAAYLDGMLNRWQS